MLILLKLLGAIAILIFGMKMTSDALQKMAGPQLRHLFGAGNTCFVTFLRMVYGQFHMIVCKG